jgi:hypothetical protein
MIQAGPAWQTPLLPLYLVHGWVGGRQHDSGGPCLPDTPPPPPPLPGAWLGGRQAA